MLLNEVKHYHKLSPESRKLLLSILLFTLALPLLSVFMNSFLWRESKSVELLTIYNIANFIGMPLGFFFNALLLQKFKSYNLYFIGALFQGIIVATLLFLPTPNIYLITLAGIGLGIMTGLYWANRTMVLMYATRSSQRTYFVGLEMILVTVMGVVVPFLTGYFIVAGNGIFPDWSKIAYQILALLLVVVLYFCGKVVKNTHLEVPLLKQVSSVKATKRWKKLRLLTVTCGLIHGIETLLPTLLVLVLMGNEKTLGTIMAVSGLFVAIVLYQIARRVGKKYRVRSFALAILLSITGGFIVGSQYSVIGVVCYFVLNAFATTIRGTIIGPLSLEVIIGEERRFGIPRYLYLLDRELYVNIGRNAALIGFFLLYIYNGDLALRLTPFLFSIPLLLGLWVMTQIEKELVVEDILESAPVYNYVRSIYDEERYRRSS